MLPALRKAFLIMSILADPFLFSFLSLLRQFIMLVADVPEPSVMLPFIVLRTSKDELEQQLGCVSSRKQKPFRGNAESTDDCVG